MTIRTPLASQRLRFTAPLFAALGLMLSNAGCSMFKEPEPERPKTTLEWMRQPRVSSEKK